MLALLAKILLQILWVFALLTWRIVRAIIRFMSLFSVRLDFRYGVYAILFNGIAVWGIDFAGVLTDNVIILNSPFGYPEYI